MISKASVEFSLGEPQGHLLNRLTIRDPEKV